MKTHHAAWLSAHPERSAAWLSERLADGFDIHHLDGNHGNNDPTNLVLIEAADHMRLHDMKVRIVRITNPKRGGRPKGSFGPRPAFCYETRQRTGASWDAIGELIGVTGATASQHAKRHADKAGLPWPIRKSRPPLAADEPPKEQEWLKEWTSAKALPPTVARKPNDIIDPIAGRARFLRENPDYRPMFRMPD